MNARVHNIETYVIAHGYWNGFYDGCEATRFYPASVVPESGFGYFDTCDAMCKTHEGTLASRARESIGWCGQAKIECSLCFLRSYNMQDALFSRMHYMLPKSAFEETMKQFPECGGCMRYHIKIEPEEVVQRVIIPLLLLQ